MVEIDLQTELDDTSNIPTVEQMQTYAQKALELSDSDKEEAQISVVIVDPAESHELNLQYRGKDRPTNVLSFPYEYPEGLPEDFVEDLLGDLVICRDVVVQEATEQNKTITEHWAHMIVHGTLHLLGYDHIEEADAKIMEPLETKIMQELGFADPYKDDEY